MTESDSVFYKSEVEKYQKELADIDDSWIKAELARDYKQCESLRKKWSACDYYIRYCKAKIQ